MSACFCRGGPTCCRNVNRSGLFTTYYYPLAESWDVAESRREVSRRLFAEGWSDPVEASHYAGYMGA